MIALFVKEWRQGYLIFIFGLLSAALLPLLYVVLSLTVVSSLREQRALDAYAGYAYFSLPLGIALFAGVGLVASEAERGTLPLLLACPISRGRIWLTKLLAGFSLATTSILVFLLSGLILAPHLLVEAGFPERLFDLVVCSFILFLMAFCWSIPCQRTITALLASFLSAAAIPPIAAFLMAWFGASLLGYDELVDIYLWVLAITVAAVVASYFTFTRGGLLRSGQRWRLAISSLVVSLILVTAVVVGAVRYSTRYQRAELEGLSPLQYENGSHAIAVVAAGDPPPFHRNPNGSWSRHPDANVQRSRHLVVVDIQTGRELLIRRGPGALFLSRDGRFAAAFVPVHSLTWRCDRLGDALGPPLLEVWDLAIGRCLYRGLPRGFPGKFGSTYLERASFSPDGEWLALESYYFPADPGPDLLSSDFRLKRTVILMRPDGARARSIESFGAASSVPNLAWDPSPGAHAVYAFDASARLVRHDIDSGTPKSLWKPTLAGGAGAMLGARLSVSPDGRWIAVFLESMNRSGADAERTSSSLTLVASDGSSARTLYNSSDSLNSSGSLADISRHRLGRLRTYAWSSDGQYFYVATNLKIEYGSDVRVTARLATWRIADEPTFVGEAVLDQYLYSITPIPGSSDVILWGAGHPLLISPDGKARPWLNAGVLPTGGYSLLGFDERHRAIVSVRSGDRRRFTVAALDVDTGAVSTIYP